MAGYITSMTHSSKPSVVSKFKWRYVHTYSQLPCVKNKSTSLLSNEDEIYCNKMILFQCKYNLTRF